MKNHFVAALLVLPFLCFAQAKQKSTVAKRIGVFISTECPISQKYIATLNEIYQKYSDEPSLHWQFVVTDRISKKELRMFIAEYTVEFPLHKDDNKKTLSTEFMASVTPQVVIMDGEVLYSGAIDNWFYGLGQYRQVITEHYLTDALNQVLKGQTPSIRKTEAVGCPIAKLSR